MIQSEASSCQAANSSSPSLPSEQRSVGAGSRLGGASSGFSQAGVRGAGEDEPGGGAAPGLEMGIYLIRVENFGESHRPHLPSPLAPCQVEGPGIREACQPLHGRKPTAQALGENKSSDLNSPAAGTLLPR